MNRTERSSFIYCKGGHSKMQEAGEAGFGLMTKSFLSTRVLDNPSEDGYFFRLDFAAITG